VANRNAQWLIVIVLLTVFSVYVALPAEVKGVRPDEPICEEYAKDVRVDTRGVRCTESIILDVNSDFNPEINIRVTSSLGLDLVGGLRVLLEADAAPESYDLADLRETANNVSRRVNGLGIAEATVQVQGSNRILVELPGVRDRQQAVNTIQQTALLEFVDFTGLGGGQLEGQRILTTEQLRRSGAEALSDHIGNPNNGNQPFETAFTGAILQAASAQFGSTGAATPEWFIAFEIKSEFAADFARFTGQRVGQPMAIVLDGVVISAPTIQAELSESGIITGAFTETEATTLALQLRSGALPIPLKVVTGEEVGATLGQLSVMRSIQAGVIGVVIVLLFMLVYYRLPGLAADLALMVFIALNLAIFKLLPVTLTLAAITGFLISIGTAVDGNILIFERIKEELRAGRKLDEALEMGFNRAWTSIRDSNFSTIIICGVLFLFGQTPGASIVSGFAVTLALGLVLNLFTAVVVTRTFLYFITRLFYKSASERAWLMGV